jgi:hypothetical protein
MCQPVCSLSLFLPKLKSIKDFVFVCSSDCNELPLHTDQHKSQQWYRRESVAMPESLDRLLPSRVHGALTKSGKNRIDSESPVS